MTEMTPKSEPLASGDRSVANEQGQTIYADPQRDTLIALLREGIEWVERPVATADDAPLCLYWIEQAKRAVA